MKTIFKTVVLFLFLHLYCQQQADAQEMEEEKVKSGIGISLGALGNYYYGPGDRNLGDFENDRVNWQLNGMFGITLTRDKNGNRTMLAGFGTFGLNNAFTVSRMLEDQNYVTSAIDQRNKNNLYLLEGGFMIAEVLRVSTGVGQQNFDRQDLLGPDGTIMANQSSLKFNSTTVGFNFNLPAIAIVLNCNFMSGKDFERTVITPSAGLMLKL